MTIDLINNKMLGCWNVGLPTNYSIIFFFYFKRNHFIFPLQDFVGTLTFQHSNIFFVCNISYKQKKYEKTLFIPPRHCTIPLVILVGRRSRYTNKSGNIVINKVSCLIVNL